MDREFNPEEDGIHTSDSDSDSLSAKYKLSLATRLLNADSDWETESEAEDLDFEREAEAEDSDSERETVSEVQEEAEDWDEVLKTRYPFRDEGGLGLDELFTQSSNTTSQSKPPMFEEYVPRAEKLSVAIQDWNLELIKELIADCDTSKLFSTFSGHIETPVIFYVVNNALAAGQTESMQAILKELVKAGLDVNETTETGTALVLAVQSKNLSVCELLLNFGASTNFRPRNPYVDGSILKVAVDAGVEFVELLLQHGAHVGGGGVVKWAHLYKAINQPQPDILEIFMDWFDTRDQRFPWREALHSAFIDRRENCAVSILRREYHLEHEETPSPQELYFKRAALADQCQVMRFLIEQEPEMAFKPWMMEGYVARKLESTEHPDFLTWLQNLQSRPLSLQVLCRSEIRYQLGWKPDSKINQLPLPPILKEYLIEKLEL